MQRVDRLLRSVDRVQQAFPVAGIPAGGHAQDRDDNGGALAYNVFFALFPLLLVVVTVLGFLLGRDSGFQQRLLGSALAEFPSSAIRCRTTSTGCAAAASAWWLGWRLSRGVPGA